MSDPRTNTPTAIDAGMLLDSAGIGLVTIDSDGNILAVNRTIAEWMRQPAEQLHDTPWLESLLSSAARAYFIANIGHLLESLGRVSGIYTALKASTGRDIPALLSAHRNPVTRGSPETVSLIFQRSAPEATLQDHLSETHEQLQALERNLDFAESRVQQANSALRAYAAAATALAHAQGRAELLTEICLGIAYSKGYAAVAFVCIAPKDITIEATSWLHSDEIARNVMRLFAYDEQQSLLRSTATDLVIDTQEDPRLRSLRGAHARIGVRSLISVPVQIPGQTSGRVVLLVCARDPSAFGAQEAEIFERLASEITFGLRSLATSDALRAERSRFAQVLENAHVPIIVSDAEGRITLFNKDASATFEYQLDEITAQPLESLLVPEDIDGTSASWRSITDGLRVGATVAPLKATGLRKGGGSFPAELSLSIMESTEGRAVTTVVRDLSEQKVSQDRLMKSARMEAFGQLASGIAHDFNNILGTIVGNIEILEEGIGKDSDLAPYPRRILASCEMAAELIRQLLIFARGSAPDASSIDVCAVVNDMAPILKQAAGKSLEFNILTLPRPAWIRADKGLLQTSLLNLVLNARDAMGSNGQIDVRMQLVPGDSDGGNVEIAVADTGSGIPADVLAKIFEPFFTTKPAGRGTGLGLAMVQGFVEHAGGKITVASEVGKGTTFTLHFPLRQDAVAPAAPIPTPTRPRGTGLRVLLVDDSGDMREIFAYRLERLGCEVFPFEEPKKALEWGTANEFDLLCTDFHLNARMTGVDLAKTLSDLKPRIGVMIVSGNLGPQNPASMSERWVTLEKPVTKDALLGTIARMRQMLIADR